MSVAQIDPKAALVLIDLQAGIVAMPTHPRSGADVVQSAVRLAAAFRNADRLVVLVHVTRAPDGSDAAPGRTDSPRPAFAPGSDALEAPIEPFGHVVVTKRNWGAFYGTDLDLQLRRRGITQIVLAGIATSMGVESTARGAHERGYNVMTVVDVMADPSQEAHENSIQRIFPRISERAFADDVIAALEGTSAADTSN